VEATSATSLAALIRYNSLLSPYKKVGVILCGGNVDLNHLPFN
jgi:threonine dehydratase